MLAGLLADLRREHVLRSTSSLPALHASSLSPASGSTCAVRLAAAAACVCTRGKPVGNGKDKAGGCVVS